MLNTRVILLDMDGVIMKHPRILRKVGENCTHYVAKKLGMDLPTSEKLNKLLYTRFSHTLLGLERLYDYPLEKMVPEFNQFVYTEQMSEYFTSENDDPLIWQQMKTDLEALLVACNDKQISVNILSNAPYLWCKTILDKLQVPTKSFDSIMTSGDDVMGCALKPQHVVYRNALQYLQYLYRDDDLDIFFVDDSFPNLVPVIDQPNWRPIHMDGDVFRIQNYYLKTISKLSEIQELI